MVDAKELVTYSSQPAFIIDGRQRVLAANEAAELLLGRTKDEFASFTCDKLLRAVQPDGGAVCCANCEGVEGLKKCRPYSNTRCYIERKDGSHALVSLNSIALPGDPLDLERPIAIIQIALAVTDDVNDTETDTRLHIHTMGRFTLSLRDWSLPLEQWPRKQAVQLLKYLCVHAGRPLHRERLIAHLWPDADEHTGWARLKVTVHFLRRRLREAGVLQDVIVTDDSSYLLRPDCVWIDSVAFADLVRDGRKKQQHRQESEALHSLDAARRLYRGDYMEGDLYADWCAEDRARLFELYIETLSTLADLHFAVGEYAAAAQDCHTILARESCRESAHRMLIKSLVALGRPESAMRQFSRCEQILRRELGISPSLETVALIETLGPSGGVVDRI